MLQRLGRVCARHRFLVLAAWVVVAVGLGVFQNSVGSATRDVFSMPGTDSQAASQILAQRFPAQNDPGATVVFHALKGTIDTPANAAGIQAAVAAMQKLPKVTSVSNPYGPLAPALVSKSGTIARAQVTYGTALTSLPDRTWTELLAANAPAVRAGVQVEFGGPVTDRFNQKNGGGLSQYADEIGLLCAMVILLFAFGSVLAMGLPITIALIGLGCSTAAIYLLSNVATVSGISPHLATMIGLGVGIDYSLFIITRYRQRVAQGASTQDAIVYTMGTAGNAVLFAGITVCMATCGLALMNIPYIAGLGYASALYVAVMIAAALTLLPALLAILGPRIERLSVRRHRAPKAVAVADDKPHGWARWAHEVAKRPWRCLLGSLAVLLLLSAPVLSMQLGFQDDGDAPTYLTQRHAYDLIAQGFGPGANAPLLVTVAFPAGNATDPAPVTEALGKLSAAISATPGVAEVAPPDPSPKDTAAVLIVVPTTGPSAPQTATLVRTLRTIVIPRAVAGSAIAAGTVHVGGATATMVDLTNRISARLPYFIFAVVLGAFFLLMVVFRSVLVPLKAAAMNLLSIGAAYGVIVAVFQWGWGKSLIGLDETGPIVAFVPMLMFAILFGLSMDYEVFLLSRIREEWLRTGDSRASVADGLAATARVITCAALIMISVFLSFVTNANPIVKMMGVGLAAAVFVDASLVRLVLVPATMELLGPANWWLPRWLDRLLPHIDVEGSAAKVQADGGAVTEPGTVTGTAPEPERVPTGAG
ncbi:MAG: Integral rane protein [Actinomycetia bacterium]|nr:Integral rane protein [Actinomycetes bacterium]